MTPLERFAEDRRRAFAAKDPWANLCVLTTVDANGAPQARTLVLRDVDGRPGVFVNATSPKVHEMFQSKHVSVLTYLASIGVQYRLRTTLERIETSTVASHWQLRPTIPKAMDWIYTNHQPQSSPVVSRESLLTLHGSVDAALGAGPVAPPTAIGFCFDVDMVERLELSSEAVHDRRRYTRTPAGWSEFVLVP